MLFLAAFAAASEVWLFSAQAFTEETELVDLFPGPQAFSVLPLLFGIFFNRSFISQSLFDVLLLLLLQLEQEMKCENEHIFCPFGQNAALQEF